MTSNAEGGHSAQATIDRYNPQADSILVIAKRVHSHLAEELQNTFAYNLIVFGEAKNPFDFGPTSDELLAMLAVFKIGLKQRIVWQKDADTGPNQKTDGSESAEETPVVACMESQPIKPEGEALETSGTIEDLFSQLEDAELLEKHISRKLTEKRLRFVEGVELTGNGGFTKPEKCDPTMGNSVDACLKRYKAAIEDRDTEKINSIEEELIRLCDALKTSCWERIVKLNMQAYKPGFTDIDIGTSNELAELCRKVEAANEILAQILGKP